MPRFSKDEQLQLTRARAVLKDPSTTPEAKSAAEKAIDRIQIERNRRIEARKLAGTQPVRKNFESEEQYKTALREYWVKLDRAVAEREAWKVLNDPNSSTLVRERAYERLGIEPPETLRRDEPISDSPKKDHSKASPHRLTDADIAEERRRERRFYQECGALLAAEKEKEQPR